MDILSFFYGFILGLLLACAGYEHKLRVERDSRT